MRNRDAVLGFLGLILLAVASWIMVIAIVSRLLDVWYRPKEIQLREDLRCPTPAEIFCSFDRLDDCWTDPERSRIGEICTEI
jgi:hypothetical protein